MCLVSLIGSHDSREFAFLSGRLPEVEAFLLECPPYQIVHIKTVIFSYDWAVAENSAQTVALPPPCSRTRNCNPLLSWTPTIALIRWYLDEPHASRNSSLSPSFVTWVFIQPCPTHRPHDGHNVHLPGLHLPVQDHELNTKGADLHY
jgi:hypothetical protein